jgi:hypothetical protein
VRRRHRTGELPAELRVFDPLRWLQPGEDPISPINVHAHAWRRWLFARADAMGLHAADVPDDDWWAPIPGRCGCPCSGCNNFNGDDAA